MLAGPIPELIDHRRLASQSGILEGSIPARQCTRLQDLVLTVDGDIHLKLAFVTGNHGHTRVTGRVVAAVQLTCQNCLAAYRQELECDVTTTIVPDEETLQTLYEEGAELDMTAAGLVCSDRELPVVDLIEDELILMVPMIPRHADGECTDVQLVRQYQPDPRDTKSKETYRPFAGLAEAIKQQNDSENE